MPGRVGQVSPARTVKGDLAEEFASSRRREVGPNGAAQSAGFSLYLKNMQVDSMSLWNFGTRFPLQAHLQYMSQGDGLKHPSLVGLFSMV